MKMHGSSKRYWVAACVIGFIASLSASAVAFAGPNNIVQTAEGKVRGIDSGSGLRTFLGIPFAKPPVGDLRWKEPQPVEPWKDVRAAEAFGPRCMQAEGGSDMVSRAAAISEDCLYLNVWTTATSADTKLPVLVYIYGGGFQGGDASEHRYDGTVFAKHDIVAVTINYRLGVFGFLALPELTKESPHHASGNYGFLDQVAALQWVQRNIAAFGGDPKRVTIAGESAGSMSVSALMGSPLSKGLIAGAIGESGSSTIRGRSVYPVLKNAEESGMGFERTAGVDSLAGLRALPASKVQELATRRGPSPAGAQPGGLRFWPDIDGYFFPKDPSDIYAAGEQGHVPLLAGSNSEESGYVGVLGADAPTVENYKKDLAKLFPGKADDAFKFYPASADGDPVMDAAQALSGDIFIAYITWKWMALSTKTGGQPTYYYYYDHPRPPVRPEAEEFFKSFYSRPGGGPPRPLPRGAVHSAEIEYALGTLDGNNVYKWAPDDYEVSNMLQGYFMNFVKTGDPNGPGLPKWAKYGDGQQRLVITKSAESKPDDSTAKRYEFLESTMFK
jgi:para-nitrobenzyl esterase